MPIDRRDETAMILEKISNGRSVSNFSTVRVAKDGRPVHVVYDISPLRMPGREQPGASAIVRDVTEQRFAEELFGLAVEASPSGMMMIDRTGHIVMANRAVERLFGYSRLEVVGRPIEILVPADLRTGHMALRAGFVRNPEPRGMGKGRELFGVRKDGSEIPLEIALTPVHIREGLLILAVVVDVSERRSNERLKNEFVATVSHELRTPLTSIAASLALLTSGKAGELPPQALRLAAIAHSNGERLVRLVSDILEIEKIEAGRVTFRFRAVNARGLVEQVIESNHAYADQVGVRLRLERASKSGEVWADPDRLAQVVANLLSNAIKFSPAGEEVVLKVEEREHSVRIAVSDHGPGIPDEFVPRVFAKFAQVDASDARKKGGTGLGLSIAKQIVMRLGGEIGFKSKVGSGTQFYVDLPRAPFRQDDGVAMETAENVELRPTDGATMTGTIES